MKAALIPCFNEAMTIAGIILDCGDYVDKIIVCDDGSTDATARIAESLGATLLKHETRQGKGEAMRSLFLKAIDMKADQVVTLDGDGQHDPKEIPKLLEGLKTADMVIGGRKGIPMIRAIGNLLLSGGSNLDTQSGFRAYKGSVLPVLIPSEAGMAVDSEIFREAKNHALTIIQVSVSVNYKMPHPSKSNPAYQFFDVAFTQFKLATFRHPLLLYGLPGFIFCLGSLFFGFRSYEIAAIGIASFPLAITQALFSLYLMLIGLSLISLAIIIWTVVTMIRRISDRDWRDGHGGQV